MVAKLKLFEMCESLLENYIFLKYNVDDAIDPITFSRLKILHSSIITPQDLVTSLQQISESFKKNNLPLEAKHSIQAEYLNIIELEAFQTTQTSYSH